MTDFQPSMGSQPHVGDPRTDPYFDPYGPLPPAACPATGTNDPALTEITREQEPLATGTFFLMIIFLMLIGAIWSILYLFLLGR